MRTATVSAPALLLLLSLAGCSGSGPSDPPLDQGASGAVDLISSGDLATPDLSAAPNSCGGAVCGAAAVCQGAPGCGSAWMCAASPGCTRDLVAYCGCDGKTFRASGSCPGQPYLHRGECGGACEAQQATGIGACDRALGVYFDGRQCSFVSGCRCEGRDCNSAYPTLELCQAAHRACKASLRANGAPCSRGAECESGVCEGMGCGVDEARCAPQGRACTRDLVPYCGCDGVTFSASSTCPGRPYRARGRC